MMWEMIKNHPCMLRLKAALVDWKYNLVHKDPTDYVLYFLLGVILLLLLAIILKDTQYERSIVLDPGQKFLDADFRHYDVYITTRPMKDNEYPEEYTIQSSDKEFIFHIKEVENK